MKNNLIIGVFLFLQMNSFILRAQDICNNTENPQISFVSAKANLDEKVATLDPFQELDESMSSSENVHDVNNYLVKTDIESTIATLSAIYVSSVGYDLATPIASSNEAKKTNYNSQYKIPAAQETVSWVDTDLDGEQKFVLRVDGKPWYMTAVQVRLDKLKGYLTPHFDATARESVIKQCAEDGFNTLQIPIMWVEVEPTKDNFDWVILDEYMGYCKKYGLKLEILWYSFSSGGRIQWLSRNELGKKIRTPDYICSINGTSDYIIRRTTDPWTLDWYDDNLLDRETYVLGQVMEHIAIWDANSGHPHTVIGVQLGNEPHGWEQEVSHSRIIDYYSKVGSAVKNSKYVVWTRLNNISWENAGRVDANEVKRNNGGTNIDFVGIDIYGTDAWKVKNDDYHLSIGKNYPMIMESDAMVSDAPIYQMAALAGGKAFSHYNYAIVDGNSLYSQGSGFALVERSHTNDVRIMNKTMNLDIADLALKAQGQGLYVYNFNGGSISSETGIEGISFTPSVVTSHGIAIRRSESEIVLMTTKGGTFAYPKSLGIKSASKGCFNIDNEWVDKGGIDFTDTSIVVPEVTAIRLVMR